ncbi:MAG TPA: GNAT family N-acetyltransferase [Candidatus Marinimicrobia bacterium]|nr:GNAT family N-acetyltransferase [Candidatus Neomarinimicrobiota bacterium]
MDTGLQTRINETISQANKGTLNADALIRLVNDCIDQSPDRDIMHQFLDLAHFQSVAKTISQAKVSEKWLERVVQLIDLSQFHTGYMIEQRAKRYGDITVFNMIHGDDLTTLSYKKLWLKIQFTGKALSVLEKPEEPPVIGLLTHNQLNGVLVDLACLSFGFRVIPIPLNSTSEHLSFILNQSEVSHLFVGGKTAIRLWNEVHHNHDISVIAVDDPNLIHGNVMDWETFFENRDRTQNFDVEQRLSFVSTDRTQTIMYTSGSTANPKGITFNQINMMSKRFARALALPEFGSDDTFLCSLPLFHTFGRYFELMGSIFWGATYSFAESPAFNSLLKDFPMVKPSIFISIPKRWVQLYEMLEEQLDLDSEDNAAIEKKLKSVTGGKLKWGLSAAGYLDPDIFKFYQTHGLSVLSGYGMTEATGGITMTPPAEYVIDSVGTALPGITLKIADDGELCLKGSYVTKGYYKDDDADVFVDGWFHTGDIFKEKDGHYFILDRKKDIYKNSRGQTIAPQKIENLFQDFDSVKSIFLVGDGREFNTVLIYPDTKNSPINIETADTQTIRDLYSSMILSVNSFLSPFERIVNFVIIKRDFSAEKGELTPKETFNRKNVLKNFAHIIEPLYEKNYVPLHSGSKEIRVPNWLLREIGTVRTNVGWDGQKVSIKGQTETLLLSWAGSKIQVGDFTYTIDSDIFEFDAFIQSPSLWLGNFPFSDFTGEPIFRLKEAEHYSAVQIHEPKIGTSFSPVIPDNKYDIVLYNLHYTVRQYLADDPGVFNLLTEIVDGDLGNWSGVVIDTFLNYQTHSNPSFRIKLIEALTPLLSGDFLVSMLRDAYLFQKEQDRSKGFSFNINRASDEHYRAFIKYLQEAHLNLKESGSVDQEFIQTVLLMVADFGTIHPTRFVWARSELIWWQISDVSKPLFSTAQKAYYALIKGFRTWIGKSSKLTIDRETGEEYTWDDVVTFEENVKSIHRKRLMEAIKETSMIRESIFLFSSNCIVGLNDIPKNSVWITHLGSRNNKSVFRILVRTRSLGTHNLVVNLNDGWERSFLEDEIKWLINMGAGFKDKPLVENFGGYWPEYQLYTEEYIHGETLTAYLERNRDDIKDESKVDRWQMRWLHFIWNGIQAYQEFWNRTEFKLSIQPPSPANLVIPQHDYSTGTRLISISGRKPTQSVADHFLSLFTDYIVRTEEKYKGLKHMSDWEVIFTATLQAVKMKKGKEILNQLKTDLKQRTIRKKFESLGCSVDRIDRFLNDIEKFGVLTKPVVFASLRFERWLDLNPHATLKARASILQALYQDYELDSLMNEYPETRVRFFMMTCFKEKNPDLVYEFQSMIQDMRQEKLSPWNLQERITQIQSNVKLSEKEKFYLARMLFPHVDAADYVELVTTTHGEDNRLNLVFQTEGMDGHVYRIRPPFLPKEIGQFHSLLSESSLSGTFTAQHDFLFMFNSRNRMVGGLYWKNMEKNRIHLEWVAVREKYRGIALSKRLMEDFYKRMKHRGVEVITVGFYVEKFFFGHGFEIDKQYGGLVKKL